MSDYDENDGMELDQSELDELRDPEDLAPEDVFSMVMINKIKKTKVRAELQDKDGDKVELSEVIAELLRYMNDKMKDTEGNQFADQIFPLVTQSMVSTLGRLMGIHSTAFYLANDGTRTAIAWSMAMAFLLLKYVQKHNLTINTFEEEVSDEEIESIERKAEANKVAMLGAMMGEDPKEVLKKMLDEGRITESDLEEMLGGKKGNGESNSGGSNSN
jgi:hypothetical protein